MGKKGRPPIEDKRDNIYRLRMNDEELAQLNFIVAETGLSKSEIIRELIYRESTLLYCCDQQNIWGSIKDGYPSQKIQSL